MPALTYNNSGSKGGKSRHRSLLLPICVIALIASTSYISCRLIHYTSSSRLADQKHVSKLLLLSELPEAAESGINQIELFMRSDWRHYLSDDSLYKLKRKRDSLTRAKTAYPLKSAILSILYRPISDEDLASVDRRLVEYQSSQFYRWVDSATKDAVQKLVNTIAIRRTSIARAKEAEAERIRELQEKTVAETDDFGHRPQDPSTGYKLGPRGGCYYITSSGNKEYVDRSNCY